jgi:hypothetical protein
MILLMLLSRMGPSVSNCLAAKLQANLKRRSLKYVPTAKFKTNFVTEGYSLQVCLIPL